MSAVPIEKAGRWQIAIWALATALAAFLSLRHFDAFQIGAYADDAVYVVLARSLVGLIMGAVLYLAVVSGFFVFGVVVGAPSSDLITLPRPEIFWLLVFIGAANDKIAEKILGTVTGLSIKLFESINEYAHKAEDEAKEQAPIAEEKPKKGKA